MSTTKSHRNLSRLICASVVLAVLCLSFGYGVGVGLYHWPPFSVLKNVQDAIFEDQIGNYGGEKELLRFAFTDPLIEGEQVYAPITSLDGIYEANRSLMLPVESGTFF